MKKIILVIITLRLLFIGLLILPISVNASSIDFEFNYNGDKLGPGSHVNLSWSSEGIDSDKTLDLYLESQEYGILQVVERGLSLNNDSYDWKIPEVNTAYDYTLSLSTNDKGPSAASNKSQEFSIYSGYQYLIDDFSAGLVSEGNGDKGIVNIEFTTTQSLGKEYFLKMNISCTDGLVAYGESEKVGCNSWFGVDDRDGNYTVKYENNTDKIQYLSFVLDLYKNNGVHIQRKFTDNFKISAPKDNLKVSAKPDEIKGDGTEELIIDINNIGAEYYIVSAGCKDGIQISGKARPDICKEGEKVYGNKDLRVDNFYVYSDRSTSAKIEVTAYSGSKIVDTDSDYIRIIINDDENYSDLDDEKDDDGDRNYSGRDLSSEDILNLMAILFGKESQAYKIISMLIDLGFVN